MVRVYLKKETAVFLTFLNGYHKASSLIYLTVFSFLSFTPNNPCHIEPWEEAVLTNELMINPNIAPQTRWNTIALNAIFLIDWLTSTENTACFDSIADNITISLTAGWTNNAVIGRNNINQTATPDPMPINVPLRVFSILLRLSLIAMVPMTAPNIVPARIDF